MQALHLSRTGLAALLDAATGTAPERIDRALSLLLDELGMQVAYVSLFRDGRRVVEHCVRAPDGPTGSGGLALSTLTGGYGTVADCELGDAVMPTGATHPQQETICDLIANGMLEPLIPDTAVHGLLATHPHITESGIGALAGVPLVVDGQARGAVTCAAASANTSLRERDEHTLRIVAAHIADLLTTTAAEPPVAATGQLTTAAEPPETASELRRLADVVTGGTSLETLTRPLLQLIQEVTGLETAYLTLLDPVTDELVIAYARNAGQLDVVEGATVPWADSICRRSLNENRPVATDVPTAWADCAIATELGVHTYISVPVRDDQDQIIGTLCAAGHEPADVDDRDVAVMTTFAQLLAAQLTREAAHTTRAARLTALESRLSALRDTADRDALTGLANRAGIHRWLRSALERLTEGTAHLVVAFVDLDSFKTVNDAHGHATGDEVLREMASSLSRIGRAGDLNGRLGGDEFVIAALLPTESAVDNWQDRLRRAARVRVRDIEVTGTVGVATAHRTRTTVDDLLEQADQAMYRAKRATTR